MRDTRNHSVYVVEILLNDAYDRPLRWLVWQAFNTRGEARQFIREGHKKDRIWVRYRIRRYTPALSGADGKGK